MTAPGAEVRVPKTVVADRDAPKLHTSALEARTRQKRPLPEARGPGCHPRPLRGRSVRLGGPPFFRPRGYSLLVGAKAVAARGPGFLVQRMRSGRWGAGASEALSCSENLCSSFLWAPETLY